MKLMMHLLYLFLWLRATWGQSPVCSKYPVQAIYSEETVLQCHLDPPQNATDKTVKWSRGADVVHVYQKGQDVPAEQKERFEGRTSLFRHGLTRGNLSLRLSALQLHDSGRYTCAFITETQERSCDVNLTVGEPEVIGSNVSLTAEVGGSITLPCHLEPPFDVENLTVEWKHNGSIVHMYRSRLDDTTSQDKSYKDRTSMFHGRLSEGNISLLLTNVTLEDSGLYICHVPKLHSQVRKGNVILDVEAQKEEGRRVDSDSSTDKTGTNVDGVVVGGVAAVAAVVAVAVGIYCRRRGHGAAQNQQGPNRQTNNGQDLPLNPLPGQEEQNMQLRQEAVPQDPLLDM